MTAPRRAAPGLWWALMAGNFVIGCGVMVVAGSLNDLTRDLAVSVAVGGGFDRRRLLTLALAWYALGHGLAALMPDYAALLPVRALSVLSATTVTPQAAAEPGRRDRRLAGDAGRCAAGAAVAGARGVRCSAVRCRWPSWR